MRNPRTTLAIVAVAVAATVGGVTIAATAGGSIPSYSTSATRSATSRPPAPQDPPGATTVHTTTAKVQGTTESILVDAKGFPLYIYKPDTATKSLVTGQLATLWPPLVASAPTARGARGTLTAVATSNGKQVAYNGHFLYTFVEDKPGAVTGQGVQNFFVATPGLATQASTHASTVPAPVNNGYY